MPRSVSLAPQQRGNDRDSVAQMLKLSLFEYPAELREQSAHGDGRGPHLSRGSSSTPAAAASSPSPTGVRVPPSASGFVAGTRSGGAISRAAQVRVFDDEGNLTTRQSGVHAFHLRRQTLFFVLRSLSWVNLLSLSVCLYLLILSAISAAYYAWAWSCGARETTSVINSFYFTIVSLAANGGYMGEDIETMGSPTHRCYRGRTLIVMFCSYANIIFVGLVAALVVGKAEYTGALANRIEFSDFCTLSRLPGRVDAWRLSFRMANLENRLPLAHGKLRLFVVSAEPLKEYKMEKRERRRLRRQMAAMEWETQQFLQGRAAATTTLATPLPLTAEHLESRKRGAAGLASSNSFTAALATVEDPDIRAVLVHKKALTTARERQKEERRARRRQRDAQQQEAQQGQPARSRNSSRSSSSSSLSSSSSSSSHLSAKTNSSVTARVDPGSPAEAARGNYGTAGPNSTSSPSRHLTPPVAGGDGAGRTERAPLMGQRRRHTHNHHSSARHTRGGRAGDATEVPILDSVSDGDEDEDEHVERVHINVSELRWSAPGETYLNKGDGQLSLWYPATIVHTIDQRSPLFRFMDMPRVGAPLGDTTAATTPGAGAAAAAGGAHKGASAAATSLSSGLTSRKFQIVAVFDATEMETGATIMAKRTYTTTDIVTHFKFSNKLVHMNAETGEVLLDYHYFNELLPVMAVESSTTDSEI